MTPPEADVADPTPGAADTPPAVSVCLETLAKRADFLAAARAKRQVTKGFILQARKRGPEDTQPGVIRVGFTCSKKVGNAVARNRAKRRLRALAREYLVQWGHPGWDYVLIGRNTVTAERAYMDLVGDLKYALKKIHGEHK